MTKETRPGVDQQQQASELADLVDQKSQGMVNEFWGLLRHNKKWWLAPIIVVSLILGVLILLFGTPIAPLIYTLF
ncbi:MAG: DUF5989 family protein [Candidatus Krumholzibacteriia bacterium]